MDKLSPAIQFQDKYYQRLVEIADGENSLDDLEDACEILAKEDEGLNAFDLKRRLWTAGLVNLGAYPWADVAAGRELFNRVVDHVSDIVVWSHPWHARVCAIFVFQSYLFEIFPQVFYLAFTSGKYGAAKTLATKIVVDLCKGGKMVGPMTVSALERFIDSGNVTLGIDEVDELKPQELKSAVEKILRHGSNQGSVAIKTEQEGKKGLSFKEVEFNIFAPKVFNFRRLLDDALLSRTIIVPMTQVSKDKRISTVINVSRTRLKTEAQEKIQADIERLTTERIIPNWNMDKIDDLLSSDSFREKLTIVDEAGAGPRSTEIALTMLLTCEVAGVDMVEEIRLATEGQSVYSGDEYVEAFCEGVKAVWEDSGRPPFMLNSDLRRAINEHREKDKEKALSFKGIKSLLRQAGFRDGKELTRVPGVGKQCTVFTDLAKEILIPDPSQLASLNLPKDIFAFTDNSLPSQREGRTVKGVKGQQERVNLLLEICERTNDDNEEKGEDGFRLSQLPSQPDFEALPEGFAEKMFERWKQEGRVWENPKDVWHMAY